MSIKAIIFDYNGVLINDLPVHVQAFVQVFNAHGVNVSEKDIWAVINRPTIEKFTAYLPPERQGEAPQLLKEKTELYKQAVREKNYLFPTAQKTVPRLARHYKLGLITNTTLEQLQAAFPPTLQECFSCIITYEKIPKPKPAPDALVMAIKQFNVKPQETVYVGDAKTDIEFARNAGCLAVGITTGTETAAELKKVGADKIINSLNELLEL